jgi:four helix bundle protein
MPPIRDFGELNVYKQAFRNAMRIYELSKRFPPEERYSLTGQIRRSSRSVCGNIAEGWRKRHYPASFVSKLSDADAESAETRVWLAFAKECGFIDPQVESELQAEYRHTEAQLTTMINHPEDWCRRPDDKDEPGS